MLDKFIFYANAEGNLKTTIGVKFLVKGDYSKTNTLLLHQNQANKVILDDTEEAISKSIIGFQFL
jgi:hypothetical protein